MGRHLVHPALSKLILCNLNGPNNPLDNDNQFLTAVKPHKGPLGFGCERIVYQAGYSGRRDYGQGPLNLQYRYSPSRCSFSGLQRVSRPNSFRYKALRLNVNAILEHRRLFNCSNSKTSWHTLLLTEYLYAKTRAEKVLQLNENSDIL